MVYARHARFGYIIYVMVITWLYFWYCVFLANFILFNGSPNAIKNVKRKNKLVDDQIMELCRSQSDARVALTYVVKDSGSFIDRKLQIMPLVDAAAPTDDVLSPRDRSEDQPEGQPAPAETKTIIIDGNRDVGFWGSFPFGRGTDYSEFLIGWSSEESEERAAGTVGKSAPSTRARRCSPCSPRGPRSVRRSSPVACTTSSEATSRTRIRSGGICSLRSCRPASSSSAFFRRGATFLGYLIGFTSGC